MKVVLSHPTGNANVRAVISALAEHHMLAQLYTTVAFNSANPWLKLLPGSWREECLRRTFPISGKQIKTFPYREIVRLVSERFQLQHFTRHEQGWACIDAIYRSLDGQVAKALGMLITKEKIDTVYAYEDCAFETFIKAKELGLKCIYDLPIAYWETARKLLQEEAERHPQWTSTLAGGILDSAAKLERKTRELEMADVVVAPGDFVNNSFPEWARKKQVIISPFGSPNTFTTVRERRSDEVEKKKNPLRVLFVGSMGQRKGLADLFDAMKLLDRSDVELIVLGSLMAPMEFYRTQYGSFTYEAGRSHERVLALMQTCDVLCLPSIVEGRALVLQEAMSQGLPLIITPNTGGADLVKEKETGFLVPIRSATAIAEKIQWFADNRSAVVEMGTMAQRHATFYTWEKYGSRIMQSLASCN